MADSEEAIVGIPVIVAVVEIEVATIIINAEHRNVTIAIDLADGALYEKPPISPSPECFAKIVSNS